MVQIKNGQSRDTDNIGHKTQNKDKQNKNKTKFNLGLYQFLRSGVMSVDLSKIPISQTSAQ